MERIGILPSGDRIPVDSYQAAPFRASQEKRFATNAANYETSSMKIKFLFAALLITPLCATSLRAGSPAQEKDFVDKYKTAFEAGDKAVLESFLYTKGANPMALEFYKMMQSDGAGTAKIAKIELVDLTPEDAKKATEVQTGPDGSKAQLPLKPTKKLKISVETKDANGSSSSSSESFVAEKDGKYVIPVPATVK
jgi:hypothetical protein